MNRSAKWKAAAASLVAIGGLLTAACGSETTEGNAPGAEGVTSKPCKNAPTGSKERGCIYLGTITDLSGIFQPVGDTIAQAQQRFWDKVNADGGIGGKYDVDVRTYLEDSAYDPATHAEVYEGIADKVLLLGGSLGTTHTLGILDALEQDKMLAGALTLWSGWATIPNVLHFADSYCAQAMNVVDYNVENAAIDSVMSVQLAGDLGGDSAAGVEAAAKQQKIEFFKTENFTNVDAAVEEILRKKPDLTMLSTGVADASQIVGQALGRGYEGRFAMNAALASVPLTALKDPALAETLKGNADFVMPFAPWGSDTSAHQEAKAAFGSESPGSEFSTLGWVSQYGILDLLQKAVQDDKLNREGLLSLVTDGFEPDYRGALPKSPFFSDDVNDSVVRSTYIAGFDQSAQLGLALETPERYEGPTAAGWDFSKPCFSVG